MRCFALVLLAAACSEPAERSEPAEPPPPAASRPPARGDDVSRLVALAAACLPDEAGQVTATSMMPLEGGPSWTVRLRVQDVAVHTVQVDPQAGTCDGRRPNVPSVVPVGRAETLIASCWEAAAAAGGTGVAGSALVREPTLTLDPDTRRVTVSFPEEDGAHQRPSGLDMVVGPRGCRPAAMD